MPDDASPNIVEFLARSEFFQGLPHNLLKEIARKLHLVLATAGESIISEGEGTTFLFLILSGEVRILIPSGEFGLAVSLDLGRGQSIGEIGFLTGVRRSATVSALSDSQLLRLTREDFDALVTQYPPLQEITNRIVQHLRRVHISTAIRRSDLLGVLPSPVLSAIEAELEFVSLPANEILFRRGEPGDDLYFVINGRLRILPSADLNSEHAVVELGPGDTVGEIAVLTGETRAATVTALRDTQLAKLSRNAFSRLITKYPQIASVLFTRKLATLMHAPSSEARKTMNRARNFAVVDLGAAASFDEFCRRIGEALSHVGTALLLSSEAVDNLMGRPAAAQATQDHAGHTRMTEYLNNLEYQFQYLIYQADKLDSGWTRRCIRQADHILLIADADADSTKCSLEADCILERGKQKSTSLILVYTRRDQRPSNTSAWLASDRENDHHHLRLNSADDFLRLARSITGNAVGLVLGGGFARGFAHAGVIQALNEARVPIDAIGGTSMGAIIAGLHAMGIDPDRIVRLLSRSSTTLKRDITIPLVALTTGRTMFDVAQTVIGETQIEDLWIPFFCVSASLTSVRTRIHKRGSLSKSVLASSRAPGIFPPIVWGDEMLVDGGIVNNLPVDIMRGVSKAGTVIAVDCSPTEDPGIVYEDYGLVLSGSMALFRRLNPFGNHTRVPNIFNVLMRTVSFVSDREKNRAKQFADLYLQPPVQHFRFNDFKKGPEIAELAYRYAKEQVDHWINQGVAAKKIW